MNYGKYNQIILKTWERGDPDACVCQITHEGTTYTGLFLDRGAMALLVPEAAHPFSFETLSKRLKVTPGAAKAVNDLLSAPTEKVIGRTGRLVQEGKKTHVELKCETHTTWFDKKLLDHFPKEAELKVHKPRGAKWDTLVAYENSFLLGVLCPVKPPKEVEA